MNVIMAILTNKKGVIYEVNYFYVSLSSRFFR